MASLLKFAAAGLLVASAGAVSLSSQKRSSSSKAGAAYNELSLVSALSTDAISWAYNWGSSSDGDLPSGVDYVPMLWGATDTYLDDWNSTVQSTLAAGSTYIMGFNEPDIASQADLSASEAASYYKDYITIYADQATLVSPAVTSSSSSGEGLSWFESFMSACSDCSVSVLAVHWYGDSVSELQSFITEAIDTASEYGISEVWLTEFALSADEGGISDLSTAASFVQEAGAWLDEQSALTRYSYFYVANGYLLTNGVLNSVGEAYTSAGSSSSSSSSSSSTTSTSTSTSIYVAPTTTSSTTSTSVYPVAPTAPSIPITVDTNQVSTSESSTEVYVAPVPTTTSTTSEWTTIITITQKVTVTTACVTTPPACQFTSSVPTPSWAVSGFVTSTAAP